MKPANLASKIFLDSGDPRETKEAIQLLGFLDGQTTNPSLIVKNPKASERFKRGDKFTNDEILIFYKEVAREVSKLTSCGSVSIEVYADKNTAVDEIIEQGKEMFAWIPNAHIKLPIFAAGLEAAEELSREGIRLNMTLCFTQEQAAAVYAATAGAKKGQVFLSPFVGRLDDRRENGMDLIANIVKMYDSNDNHVEVLSASIRNLDHFLRALQLKSDIITAPFKILKEWAESGMIIPGNDYAYKSDGLSGIAYQDIDLNKNWREYNIKHELTDKGIECFARDWNSLIKL